MPCTPLTLFLVTVVSLGCKSGSGTRLIGTDVSCKLGAATPSALELVSILSGTATLIGLLVVTGTGKADLLAGGGCALVFSKESF